MLKTTTVAYRFSQVAASLSLVIGLALFVFSGESNAFAEAVIAPEVVVEELAVAEPVRLPEAAGAPLSSAPAPDVLRTTFKKKWKGNEFSKRHNKYLKYDKHGQVDPSPDVVPLDYLPRDNAGFIDWTRAMREGLLKPSAAISAKRGEEAVTVRYDEDVVLRPGKTFMPDVIFPHDAHNDWLNCGNCHDGIFKMKKKASGISMVRIWGGEFCGRCHDKVAFPLRHCFRCHAGERGTKFKKPAPVPDNYVEFYEYE